MFAAQSSEMSGIVAWIADVISALGWPGVSALVAIENVFPPIPSEIVLPFAGFAAGWEAGSPWVMTFAATGGSVVGAMVLYELGRQVGQDRTRRLMCRLPLVEEHEVDGAIDWFHRHGTGSVFFGRFMPFVRSAVSLPAGAARMHRGWFLLLTGVGSLLWNALWVWAGYLLGRQWRLAGRYSDWLNYGLVVVAVVVVGRYVWRRRGRLPGR